MIELRVTKRGGMFVPWSDDDKEEMKKIKHLSTHMCRLTKETERNLQHHQLYWSGLLGLAMDYWDPISGLLSPTESKLIDAFARVIEKEAKSPGVLDLAKEEFKKRVRQQRAEKIGEVEKTKDMLHRWIKEELGYYDLEVTPAGCRKVLRSISFSKMGQDEFDVFYKEAFNLIWRMVLYRVFDNEQSVQDAVMARLESMG
jgi:hypothetical protein